MLTVVQPSHNKKALNRTGRAICRIMDSHQWSHKAIARILLVSDSSVTRAVDNIRYNPRDRIEEDYDRVDPEFRIHFPPQPRTDPPRVRFLLFPVAECTPTSLSASRGYLPRSV
jgi:hypothetical protein